ncbi:MAG: hypothetical protein ACRECN_06300, partial [Methylocella sp.]
IRQDDKGARDLNAAARDNILELMAGDPAIEIDIDTKADICFTAFDRHVTKRQRWRNFFPGTRLA